jgi:hypothetical protein
MKTTVEIADDLADAAREKARHRGFQLRDASVGGSGLNREFADQSPAAAMDAAYEGAGGDCR